MASSPARKTERDRKVVIEKAPRFGMVGQEQTVTFRVEEANGPGQPVTVAVAIGGGEPHGDRGDARARPSRCRCPIDHGGQNIVEITAPPLEGEISAPEQPRRHRDRGRARPAARAAGLGRAASGRAHAGATCSKADASVDLVHFTILRPPEKQDGTPTKELALIAFPTRELFVEKLDEFDLVIFDRYRRQTVLPAAYMANIARYVADGGAVLIASGPDLAGEDGLYYTPLSDIIAAAPTGQVLEGAFKPELTDAGQEAPGDARPSGLSAATSRAGAAGSASSTPRRARARRSCPASTASRCWCWRARARAAWRSSSPTRAGCGRAASRAAARRPSCCAASPTG